MFRNNVVFAWRNLMRSRIHSFINIGGLAIGLASCIAIALFIEDEYSYDRFHQNADNIYRVVQRQNQAGEEYDIASTPGPLARTMESDFAAVTRACLLGRPRTEVLRHGSTSVESSALIVADQGFFKVFDFRLLRGNGKTIFSNRKEILLTETLAKKLFGSTALSDANLNGLVISGDGDNRWTLAGIVADPPVNSHIQFDAVTSFDPAEGKGDSWVNNNFHTYVQLAPDADPQELNEKLRSYLTRYRPSSASSFDPPVLSLQPLTDIYLYSNFDFQTDWAKTGDVVYVRIFFVVAVLIFLIAVFNFINLSTARATRRAREIGIRKAIGAARYPLAFQFFTEAFLVTALAVVIAAVVLMLALPFLNDVSAKSLRISFTDPVFIITLLLVCAGTAFCAGIYPAIFLSGFKPVKALKGVFDAREGKTFREILVVAQFAFTVVLATGSIFINRQMTFLRERNLGFDQSQLIYVKTKDSPTEAAQLFKQRLKQETSIVTVALVSSGLVDVVSSTYSFDWEGKKADENFLLTQVNVDPDYLAATGMTLLSGRDFDPEKSDTTSFIVNETAARRMGWTPAEALDKSFSIWNLKGSIIGVVVDFHYRPMTYDIEPLVLMNRPDQKYTGMLVKVNAGRIDDAVSAIGAAWKAHGSGGIVSWNFVDDELSRQYAFESRAGRVVVCFCVLAIVVACLGLYGLASFSSERRRREVGVRKVFGASLADIVGLLSRNLVGLVLISVGIALPVGYFLVSTWLEGFVYRTELDWYFFAAAGSLPLFVAGVTVVIEAATAARRSPMTSLKLE